MNKEEKKAIEYYQNKEISFSVDFDKAALLKALGIEETEEDSFDNHQIRFKTLLNLIEKLQKENEKYKRLSEMNLKNAEEFKNNMCEHRCLLKSENEELKKFITEGITIEPNSPYSNYQLNFLRENFISKQKIKDKIEEIKNIVKELSQEIEEEVKSEDICREYIRDKRRELGLANRDIKLLQELLEREE